MFEGFVLGAIQGITEWLPISSEGALVLAEQALGIGGGISGMISLALFLHLGTFFAALIYFWSDVVSLLKTLFNFQKSDEETRRLLIFLIIATFISGFLGSLLLFGILREFEDIASISGKTITLLIGVFLLITAFIQLRSRELGVKDVSSIEKKDSVLLGFAQGLSVLPGVSRSGITVASLLLMGFTKQSALRISFLLSLPIVLGGNIALGFSDAIITNQALWGLLFSFLFGLVTIKALFIFAEKINFGWFVFAFGALTILSTYL